MNRCDTPGCGRWATTVICEFLFGIHRYCDACAARLRQTFDHLPGRKGHP